MALSLMISICMLLLSPVSDGSFTVMFWNLENFFDWKDSGYSSSDHEFSASGERRWTRGRFYAKCNAVSKTVLWTGSRYGSLPDIICFAEVENAFVLKSIAYSTALKKYGYGIVHYESDDKRGIDVGLIYRKDRFRCTGSEPHKIYDENGNRLPTRDILEVTLQSLADSSLKVAVLVNHHPSKFGGEKISFPRRKAAMYALAHISDSLERNGYENIVAAGDFNDTPDGPAMDILDGILYDLSYGLHMAGKGTIRYRGKWELIDLMFVSEKLEKVSRMEICTVPFLLADDSSAAGKKPLRTYSGPRYIGGVSDHLPIMGFFKPDRQN